MALSAEDKIEVGELLSRYIHAMDGERDLDALLDVFSEDAIFEGPTGQFVGHEGIRAWCARGSTPGLRHLAANVVVTGDGNEAVLKAYLITVITAPDGETPADGSRTRLNQAGAYEIYARKERGIWRAYKRIARVDGI